MPFLKKYKESRIKQLEQKCQKNGFISYFVDPERGFFYKGNWKNDKKSGFGHQVFRREKLCYEGYFENDLFHGYGRLGGYDLPIRSVDYTRGYKPNYVYLLKFS